ncbi:MAG: hypothetical protein Q9223_007110 [Gallowayella weberi]
MAGFSWFSTWPSSPQTGSHPASELPDSSTEALESPVVLFDAMAEGDEKEDGNVSSDETSWPSTPLSRVNTPSVSTTSEDVAVAEKSEVPQKQEESSGAPDSLPQASQADQATDFTSRSISVDHAMNGKAFKLAAPHPDAPLVEVQEFLTAWFIHTYDFSEEEGLRYAQKLEADAQRPPFHLHAGDLYACSRQRIEDIFGLDSELYDALQFSQYGKTFNIWHHIPFLGAAVTFLVTIHNFNIARRGLGGHSVTFVLPTLAASMLHTLLDHAFVYCTSTQMLNSAGFPERLKGRPWCIGGRMDYAVYLAVNLALVWMIPLPVLLWRVLAFLGWFLLRI